MRSDGSSHAPESTPTRRRRRRKALLISELGGRCVDCGYSGCDRVFELHHRDRSTKEFGLADFSGSNARFMEEAKKCVLLCANCHRLRHAAQRLEDAVSPVVAHRRRRKQMAVAYMGGHCFSCDRDGPPCIFEFHHWDADQKAFGISQDGNTRSWQRVLAELQKCVMLCANCHREVHSGVRRLDEGLDGLAEDAIAYAA